MSRREILALVCRMRKSRDRCGSGPFERGMRASYHLSAHMLWRDFRDIYGARS